MNGILLIDKPAGWTSSDVVAKLRGMLRERRIGHSGTLDPMATGLLVIFIGRATRAVEYAEAHDKCYLAGFRPGIITDTQDITGHVLETRPVIFSEEELQQALRRFTGEQDQLPPMYSAIKINGQKLYDIARRGGEVERKPRHITISALEYTGHSGDDLQLRVECSKGTYIRTLCHDLGAVLGCGGCMSALRRIRAGQFELSDAHTLEEVQTAANEGRAAALLLPVDSLFKEYGELRVSKLEEKKLRCGNPVDHYAVDGTYRVYSQTGEFLLLGTVTADVLKTEKSFFEVS